MIDSDSIITESTVNSSIVERDEKNLNFNDQQVKGVSQNNVKLESCQQVRVGDVFYQFYSPPTKECEWMRDRVVTQITNDIKEKNLIFFKKCRSKVT